MMRMKWLQNLDLENGEELAVYRLESGGLVGVDGSFLEQIEGPLYSPYDYGEELEEIDSEIPQKCG